MSPRRMLAVALAAAALLAACAAPPSAPAPASDRQSAFPPGPPPPPMPEPDPSLRAAPPPLVGTVWAWQETLQKDENRVAPGAPDRYTLEFRDDGRVSVRADCNRGNASYVRDGDRLTFGPIALTRARCPPGSRDGAFVKGLVETAGSFFAGPDLVLELADDAGTMRFRALPR